MAQITLNIPNNKIDLILSAITETYNYSEFITDENGDLIPNPISKAEFSKGVLINYIKDIVKGYKIRTDSQSVLDNANTDSNNLNIT